MNIENPEPLRDLIHKLQLPSIPFVLKYTEVKKGKITGIEYQKLRRLKEIRLQERKEFLKPYRAGTYREYEGGGYFTKPLYLFEGKYYA